MKVVSVLSPERRPLMPCASVVARLLLKEGKAKVVGRTPFPIKLVSQPESTSTQALTLGVDTGSCVMGSAVAEENGKVLSLSETSYRKARWLNRRNSIRSGRFSATMRSKINAHLREIRLVQSRLPITCMVLETGTFDPHALNHPEDLQNTWLYQKGITDGFANTKADVLTRDGYIKGRMSTGYAILMDLSGKKQEVKPIAKFAQMQRVSARSSWMISQKAMPSFSSSLT